MHKTAVLLTGFNRPDLLEKSLTSILVFDQEIDLYIHLDGPRENSNVDNTEINKCINVIEKLLDDTDY